MSTSFNDCTAYFKGSVMSVCKLGLYGALSLSLRFNGHFPGEPGLAVFIEAKDDGGGGDNWTTGATRRAKLQSNHHHQQTTILFRL